MLIYFISHYMNIRLPILLQCDRMDNGILFPDKPIDILKETETTALLDGNLGLGLYIGPYAMDMAIKKAKKHGVGFVAVTAEGAEGAAGGTAAAGEKAPGDDLGPVLAVPAPFE